MTGFDPTAPKYRYFVTDLLSNSLLAEIPFQGVSYERSLKSAGKFSGNIAVIDETDALNLYENTMPGKTGLYVVRDNECVWGGIIWSRSYSLTEKSLSVQGAEFTSYLYHRNIWRTFSHDFGATAVKSTVGGLTVVTLSSGSYDFTAGAPVKLEFYDVSNFTYNGYYTVLASGLTDTSFAVSIPSLPVGTYASTTVKVRVDTYDYTRELLTEMQVDFSNIQFPNSELQPGVRNEFAVSTRALTDNVVTLTTSSAHDLSVGQTVDVENIGASFDGSYTVTATTTNTVSYAKTATNVVSAPTSTAIATVTKKELDATTGLVTLTTSSSHSFSVGQYVDIENVDDPAAAYATFDGRHLINSTPTSTTFTYYVYVASSEVYEATITSITHPMIESTAHAFGLFWYFCDSIVPFKAGDTVTITGVDPAAYNITGTVYNVDTETKKVFTILNAGTPAAYVSGGEVSGHITITADNAFSVGDKVSIAGVTPSSYNSSEETVTIATSTYFAIASSNVDEYDSGGSVNLIVPLAGSATVTPRLFSNTYGPFPGNSDIGIDFSTNDYSGVTIDNRTYRGYELRSIGEELDEYSDTVDGFEYRIDCAYDPTTSTFTRTFVLLPINVPNPPAPGEVSPLSRFGADELVFEYPGNINTVTMDESAENAATRFFVVGNISDLGDEASQPYAVASATDLLNAGWPILDESQTRQDAYAENQLYDYAQRYLSEFRPPVTDLKIGVNGSIAPVVGTYAPGDWCAVIIYDNFVQMRMSSDLEIRDDILVRKIENIKVRVPDGVAFPEEVELLLFAEWEVDKVGE
jgi:hypothetical protein